MKIRNLVVAAFAFIILAGAVTPANAMMRHHRHHHRHHRG